MELQEFRDDFIEDLKFQVATEDMEDKEALMEYFKGVLIDAEEIDDLYYVPFEGIGKRRSKIEIDGYSFDELDEVLNIFICSQISYNGICTLTKTEALKYFERAQNFIEDKEYIVETAEESSAGYGLAYDLVHKYQKVKKYRIFLLTDMIMSDRIKDLKSKEIDGIPVEFNIWDMGRIYQLENSKTGKEDIVINLLEYSENGIPCLHANETEEYDAYLCNIPGYLLANLYNNYGSRLLEGNVRSFLQTKGKVNKGIRNTILNNPTLFFAYNNGIAGTASEISTQVVNGNLYIKEITALQIVNGGQTTASLAMALLNDKKDGSEESIRKIFVPMKLSVVDSEKAKELIPNISRYANSQNKVSEADLWSNHPFHIRMEEFSRKTIAPAVNGNQYGTHWYYERANGQYKQETYKCTPAEKKKFELSNPSNQLFKKVDLAKYWNIMNMRPDIASAGGQKAFAKFATYVSTQWEKDETVFNKGFFEDIISMAILFKGADKIVKNQTWFNSYKANIVAYTLSVIIYTVNQKYPKYSISFHDIWQKQSLSEAWQKQIATTSKLIYDFLIDDDREVENVTEWAKREKCWKKATELNIVLSDEFINELNSKEDLISMKKSNKKDQKLTNDINQTLEVYNYGVENWKKLIEWNNSHGVLNYQELEFIQVAINIEKGKVPSDKQSARIMQILNRAREEGYPK